MSGFFNRFQPLRRELWICLVLAILTFVAFSQGLRFGFTIFDDPDYVTGNDHVRAGLTRAGFAWAFTGGHAGNWHPLTWLSHMLDCQIYGLKPWGHHLTNLLFHTTNVLLLFGLLRGLTGAIWRSAIVAALFAWHPLRVESVAWISERKDVLSAFFWLLATIAYCRYAAESKAQSPKSKVFYFLALVLFALGLMAKPMVVTLPFVLLLLDYWPLNRLRIPGFNAGLIWEKLPFFLLVVVSCVVTYQAQKSGGAMTLTDSFPLSDRIANALVAYIRYVGKTFWPANLAVFYPMPAGWPEGEVLGALLLLAAATALFAMRARAQPWLLVGWLWFLGTLVPVIGLVQVGQQSMADRYSYIPCIGIFIALTWAAENMIEHFPRCRVPVVFGGGVFLAVCLGLTWFQVRVWQSSISLFSHSLTVTGSNELIENILGRALDDDHRPAEAIPHFNAALKINPASTETLCNLGLMCVRQQKKDEAIAWYEVALRYQPTLAKAHFNLATLLAEQGKPEDALLHYAEVLRVEPWNPSALKNSGVILAQQGKLDDAVARLREAIRLRPEDAGGRYALGLALVTQGKLDEAIANYKKAVRLQPDWSDALNDLAWLLATHPRAELRNGVEAVRLAERACALTTNTEAQCLGTLDAAYAETGRFPEAIATAEKAKALARASGANDIAEAAEKRIQLYRTGRPYHQE